MPSTQFVVGNHHHVAPSTHIGPIPKHVPSSNLYADSVQIVALMSEVDRWLVILQKGIRELEERHKRHLASGSGVDGLSLSGPGLSEAVKL